MSWVNRESYASSPRGARNSSTSRWVTTFRRRGPSNARKGDHRIPGYFDFVVPTLEGLWWQPGANGMDYNRKDELEFFSMIRMPDFVTEEEFAWVKSEAARKKRGTSGRSSSSTSRRGSACSACTWDLMTTSPRPWQRCTSLPNRRDTLPTSATSAAIMRSIWETLEKPRPASSRPSCGIP